MEIICLMTSNEDNARHLFFKLLEQYNIQLPHIDEALKDEGIAVLFGVYCYDFIELCNRNEVDSDVIKRYVRLVSDIVDSKNQILIELIKTDFFPSIYGEVKNRELIESLLTPEIMEMYKDTDSMEMYKNTDSMEMYKNTDS